MAGNSIAVTFPTPEKSPDSEERELTRIWDAPRGWKASFIWSASSWGGPSGTTGRAATLRKYS